MIEDSGRTGGKRGRSRGTAFYIEALLLTAVFAIVILALAKVFAWSGRKGRDAVLLTGAVHLAENGAEAVAASDSLEEVRALLEENGNAEIFARSGTEDIGAAEESAAERAGADTLRVYYDDDLNPVPDGTIWMEVRWMPEWSGEESDGVPEGAGLVKSLITVNRAGEREPIYALETEVFAGMDLSQGGF